jgi:hypothetical protein
MSYSKTVVTILGLIFSVFTLNAQSFRGNVVRLDVPPPDRNIEISIGSGDVAVISVPEDQIFTAGLDIRLRPPSDVQISPGMFSLVIYAAVDAPDEDGVVTIGGTQREQIPITTSATLPVVVGFSGEDRPSTPAGTRFVPDVDPRIGDVGIQLVPITKGMSQELLETTFTLRVAPVVRPKGGLVVHIDGEEDAVSAALEVLRISVDGLPLEEGTVGEFSPGIYRLTAEAGDYLSHTANVGIERGVIRELTLTARQPRAQVRINVPSVAEVFWNGELVSDQIMSVEPGAHTLLIRLGDFSLSRRVELEPNGDYQLGVDLDILLKRN